MQKKRKCGAVDCIVSVLCVATLASVAGVRASWKYAGGEYKTTENDGEVGLTVFAWDGAEELPEDSSGGENHIALVERIVYSTYGLNNASSHLNDVIEDRKSEAKDTASSVAPTQGGNLKDLFNTSEMQKLDFLLWFVFDEQGQVISYELFTFETSILGTKEGVRVTPVYRTLVVLDENGKWKPSHSEKGSALTIKYDAKQGGGKNLTVNETTFIKTT